ncbi:malonyl-ACP O-methyltransferase BioC [Halanaerocella petrolearia]
MIDKELVKNNFSKAANSYEEYAIVQKHMALKLRNWLNAEEKLADILEVGVGTGVFTELLVNSFSNSNYLLIDISPEMIKRSKEKFKDQQNIDYLITDAEELDLERKFDLITSNATFQWFQDLKKAVKNFKDSLKQQGKIYFSTFGARNFHELRSCLYEISPKYNYSQEFYSKDDLKELLSQEFKEVYIEEEEYIEEFNRVRDFLKATKKIGANSAKEDKPTMTPGLLKKLEHKYRDEFSKEGQIVVTHHLLFVRLKK